MALVMKRYALDHAGAGRWFREHGFAVDSTDIQRRSRPYRPAPPPRRATPLRTLPLPPSTTDAPTPEEAMDSLRAALDARIEAAIRRNDDGEIARARNDRARFDPQSAVVHSYQVADRNGASCTSTSPSPATSASAERRSAPSSGAAKAG